MRLPSPLPALVACGAFLALGLPTSPSEGGSPRPGTADGGARPQVGRSPEQPRTAVVERTPDGGETVTADSSSASHAKARTAALPSPMGPGDIPAAALDAYRNAAALLAQAAPDCRLGWSLLAAIGKVESDHGRFAGAVLGRDAVARPAILGVPLDGTGGVAAISDTDDGTLDHDTRWDRAVGPMQFLPGTWEVAGADGDGDGRRSPHDLDDAAVAAGVYLCAGASGLDRRAAMRTAVLRYNHSSSYATTVLSYERLYRFGAFAVSSPPILSARLVSPTVELRVPAEPFAASPARPQIRPVPAQARPRGRDDRPDRDPLPRPDDAASPHQEGPQQERVEQKPGATPAVAGGAPVPPVEEGSRPPAALAVSPDAPAEDATDQPGSPADHSPTRQEPTTVEVPDEEQPAAQDQEEPGQEEPADQAPEAGLPPQDSTDQAADPDTAADPTDETALEGIWRHCDEEAVPDYCLDDRRLLLGPPELLDIEDLDGDGRVVTPRDELDTVVGRAVRVRVLSSADGWVLMALVLLPADAAEGGGGTGN